MMTFDLLIFKHVLTFAKNNKVAFENKNKF